MTLPLSGPISINDLRTEFSGPTPSNMAHYYRGGAYVPNTATNAGVPTSGTISLQDFYGASAQIVVSINVTVGRSPGVLGFNEIDSGYHDGNPSVFTQTSPWSVPGSVSSTAINGNTLTSIGFSNLNGAGPPVNDVNQRNFWVEFAGNVTGNPPTSIDVTTFGGTVTNYSFSTGLINWLYNGTVNRTVWRHTFGALPIWNQTDVGSTFQVDFNF